jgi:malate dehydrogenase (oxaloacetate-decarboxylating)
VAITDMLIAAGIPGANIIVCDSSGIVYADRPGLTPAKAALAANTNYSGRTGGIREALIGADVLIGVSGGSIAETALSGMAPGGIIFALANPTPEVPPQIAARHAAIVATGRSDFPNQINNVLAFPGIFRGALDARAITVTDRMKVAAADAIAQVVADDLRPDAIVPSALDPRVAPAVADAVARAAERDGVARMVPAGRRLVATAP